MARLANRLDIRPGEGVPILLLLGYSCAAGASNVFMDIGATTIFLTTHNPAQLPLVYIAAAVVLVVIGAVYSRLARRVSAGLLLGGIIAFLCVGTLLFSAGLRLSGAPWITFALLVWDWAVETYGALVFWALAGRLFNLEQGKRLFGLVGSGDMGVRVLALFLMPTIVPIAGTATLIPIAAAALALCFASMVILTRRFDALRRVPAPSAALPMGGTRPASEAGRAYVAAILATSMITTLLVFFISFGFSAASRARHPDPAQLAQFIAIVNGVMNAGRLAGRLFISRPLLARYGILFGLLALPIGITAGMGGILVAGLGLGALGAVFWLMTFTRLAEGMVRQGLQRGAWQLLYQPLPADQRLRVIALVEGIAQPVAIALAGLALLGLRSLDRLGMVDLAAVGLPLCLALIAGCFLTYRGYLIALRQALGKGRLAGQDLVLDDASTLGVIEERLASPHRAEVLYALDLLERAGAPRLGASLVGLLDHADPLIRREAAGRIARLRVAGAVPALGGRVVTEHDPDALAAAIQALASVGRNDAAALASVRRMLDDPRPELQVEASVGLLRAPENPATSAARVVLDRLATSPMPQERILAARALGQLDAALAGELLAHLLGDPELTVRRAALLAAGQARAPQLWPAVVVALGQPNTARAAARALTAGGAAVLPTLAAAAADGSQRAARLRLAARLGPDAVLLLRAHLDDPDAAARDQALRGLARWGYRASVAESDVVRRLLRDEVAAATGLVQAQADLAPLAARDESTALLRRALERSLHGHRVRVCLLLALLHDAATLLRVEATLAGASAERRAFAQELLSIAVAPNLRRIVLPLFADLTPAQYLQRLAPTFPQRPLAVHERLAVLLAHDAQAGDPWLRICALAVAATHGGPGLLPGVIAALADPSPLVRETALRALARLDRLEYARWVGRLVTDTDAQVTRAIRAVEAQHVGGMAMLSTIEKVIILKAVGLFARLDDATLADLAVLLAEETVPTGTTVIAQGDEGTSMYIIVDGEVRVHADGYVLNDLGARDLFGEMALLDPELRIASVTALTDCRLLRLDQGPFYELLEDHIDVTRGIIQVLSARLRDRVRDLNAARIAAARAAVALARANGR